MVSYELRPNPEPSPLRPRQHGLELIRPLGNKAPDLETRSYIAFEALLKNLGL